MRKNNNQVNGQSNQNTSKSKLILGRTDLQTVNPKLAEEWNHTRNGSLVPDKVYSGSHVKVWWICKNSHEWLAAIYNRVRGCGCPYCSNRRVLSGYNDLQTVNPCLAEEWHPTLNGTLTPSQVLSQTNSKVWWMCEKGHEWESTVNNRAKGNGCPYCAGKKVLSGYNDLLTTNPILAREWHPEKNGLLKSTQVSSGSQREVWWLCDKGHEWIATIKNRVSGNGCPYCSNKKVLPGYNDLLTVNQSLAREWHPTKNGTLTPQHVIMNSERKVWWMCEGKHEWQATIVNRARGKGCPYCANKKCLPGYNDLQTVNPCLAEEWHPTLNGTLTPSQVLSKSAKKVWWRCNKGHEWKTKIVTRALGANCPECVSGLKTSFPEQAVFFYLSQKYKAINRYEENRYELDVFLPDIRVGIEYDGIYYHTNERSQERENRKNEYYKSRNIRIIRIKESDANRIEGDVVFYEFNRNHDNLPWAIKSVFSLLNQGMEVPHICLKEDGEAIYRMINANEKANSLASKCPTLIKEWDFQKNRIDPSLLARNSTINVWWKCKKGHEWKARISSRVYGAQCPYCSSKKLVFGYNDLQTVRPELAKEWHRILNDSLTPDQVHVGSHIKVWWLCDKGHKWCASVVSRTRIKGTGCPYCSKKRILTGYNDLLTLNPNLVKEWHPTRNGEITPSKVGQGVNKKVWWICDKGHEWNASVNSRAKGSGCPTCGHISTAIALSKKVVCVETGITYDSITQAQKSTKTSHICDCLFNRRETAGGFHWRYVDSL